MMGASISLCGFSEKDFIYHRFSQSLTVILG